MSPQTDPQLQTRARDLYRRAAADTDTATAARLREARRKALDAADRPRFARWLMPMGAVATCALAAVLIWPSAPMPSPNPASMHNTTHATASSNDDVLPPDPETTDPALYEDMDFYAWLADQPHSTHRVRRGG